MGLLEQPSEPFGVRPEIYKVLAVVFPKKDLVGGYLLRDVDFDVKLVEST
jgi:hypothetical protein